MQSELSERPRRRIDIEVDPRRSDRVLGVQLHVWEIIFALNVGYGQTILRPAEANRDSLNRVTLGIEYAAIDLTRLGREFSERPMRKTRDAAQSGFEIIGVARVDNRFRIRN